MRWGRVILYSSKQDFLQQIAGIINLGYSICSIRDVIGDNNASSGQTILTFDDGHISNYQTVLPALIDNSATADFFINPENVGKQKFVSWPALREMAAAGMSIQSHGYRHIYLTLLSQRQLRESLLRSKLELEDKVGTEVVILAPPGGRIDKRVVGVAQDVGYKYIANSRAGRWPIKSEPFNIPRFAVTRSTTLDKITGWASGRIWPVCISSTKYWVSCYAKKLAGDKTYDRLRALMLGSHSKK